MMLLQTVQIINLERSIAARRKNLCVKCVSTWNSSKARKAINDHFERYMRC